MKIYYRENKSKNKKQKSMGTTPFKSRVQLRELKWPLLSPTFFLDYSNPRPQESLHWHPTGTHGSDNSWICFIWTKGSNNSVWMGSTCSWDSAKVWTFSRESMCFSTDSREIVEELLAEISKLCLNIRWKLPKSRPILTRNNPWWGDHWVPLHYVTKLTLQTLC